MKYKIQKLQGGGFATFTPIIQTPPTQPSGYTGRKSSDDDDEGGSLVDKDLFKEIVGKGLVNDVDHFTQQLMQLDSGPLGLSQPQSREKFYQLMSGVNQLLNNKQNWEQSVKFAEQAGGLGEVAVGPSGEIYVRDKDNKINTISIDKYKSSGRKYNPLTVSELMMARQYDPQLVYNKSIFSVANQAISLQTIAEDIQGMIDNLSEFSMKTDRTYSKDQLKEFASQFGGKTPTEEDLKSLQKLQEALQSPGDYVNIKEEHSTKARHIDKALGYIWGTLGRNKQLKLEAAAAMNGSTSKQYIYDMLVAGTEPQTVSEITPKSETSIKGSASEKGLESLTAFQMFHKDKMVDPLSTFAFNDPKLNVLFRGAIGAVGPLMTKKDESIGFSTVGQILSEYDYNMIADGSKVYFGDKPVEVGNMNNVIYDPTSSAAKIYMPVDEDGKPDYESFKEFKQIYAEYEQNKDSWTKLDAEKHFRDAGFNLKIDEIGGEKVIRNNSQVKPFLVMYAYTNDATGLTKDNPWIQKVSSDEKRSILPILEQVWTIGTGKNAKSIAPDKRFNIEDYYKGIVTIPYRNNITAVVDALVKQGPTDRVSSIMDVQRNIWQSNQPASIGSGNAQQLNME